MHDAIFLGSAAALSLLSMVWIALAMDVHWAQCKGIALEHSKPPSRVLRGLSVATLCVSLLLCLMADRPSIAVLVWVMLQTSAAVAIAWCLSRFPSVLNVCWPFSGLGNSR